VRADPNPGDTAEPETFCHKVCGRRSPVPLPIPANPPAILDNRGGWVASVDTGYPVGLLNRICPNRTDGIGALLRFTSTP
jgi:hypothetical protein